MNHPVAIPNRRECLKLGAAVSLSALLPSAAFAQGKPSEIAVRFQIAVKGTKFGVKIVRLKDGTNMMSLRELAGKRRYAYKFNFDKLPDTNSVNLKIGDKSYQVARKGDWITTNVPGVTIGYPEALTRSAEGKAESEAESEGASEGEEGVVEVPAKLQEGSRGFVSWLKGAVSSVWSAVKGTIRVVGIAISAAVVLVMGGAIVVEYGAGHTLIIKNLDGKIEISGNTGGQFMPPPPGTPLDPTVWY